jgi:mobilization protein
MIVKFFKNKSGGSARGIDYLLDKRVGLGSARVICGSEATTRAVLSMVNKKQKLTIGCLSFNELDMNEETKLKIIRSFEEMIFGSVGENFNILWVEHLDKANLELNFCIPKVELLNFRSFNPYYHKKDFSMINTWKNLINLKYGLTDPCDPKNQHIVQGSKKDVKDSKNYEELEKIIVDNLIKGKYRCRDDILKSLQDSDIEVTRIGKDYVSVKLPGSKKSKRFKGEIFHEKFRSLKDLGELSSKARERARAYKDARDNAPANQILQKVSLFRAFSRQDGGQSIRYKFREQISRKDLNIAILAHRLKEAKNHRNSEIKNLLSLGEKRYGAGLKFELEADSNTEAKIGFDQIDDRASFVSASENEETIIKENINDRYEHESGGDRLGESGDIKRDGLGENEFRGAVVYSIKTIQNRILSKQADIRSLISDLERKREHRTAKQSDIVVKRADIKELGDVIDANEKTIDITSSARGLFKRFGRNVKELYRAFGEFAGKFDKVVRAVAGLIGATGEKSKLDKGKSAECIEKINSESIGKELENGLKLGDKESNATLIDNFFER